MAYYTTIMSLVTLLSSIMLTAYGPTVTKNWIHRLVLTTSSYLFPIAAVIALIAVLIVKATHPHPNIQRSLAVKHPVTVVLFAVAVLWIAGRIIVLTLGPTD